MSVCMCACATVHTERAGGSTFLLSDMCSGNQTQSPGLTAKYLFLAEPVLKKVTERPYSASHALASTLITNAAGIKDMYHQS